MMPGALKGIFEAFLRALVYSVVYFVIILLLGTYLRLLGSREIFVMLISGFTIALLALWLGFGTEYVRLWLKYRHTDFSSVRRFLRALIFWFVTSALWDLLIYLLRVEKVLP
jgi:hypothetical protein